MTVKNTDNSFFPGSFGHSHKVKVEDSGTYPKLQDQSLASFKACIAALIIALSSLYQSGGVGFKSMGGRNKIIKDPVHLIEIHKLKKCPE